MPRKQEEQESEGYREAAQAEITVLGAMLVEPESIYTAIETLTTMDFILSSHRSIYGAILSLFDNGDAVDIITVAEELKVRGEFDTVGRTPYLASLSEGLPRKLNIESYVRIVKEKARMRRLGAVLSSGFQKTQDQANQSFNIMADVQNQFIEEAADWNGGAVKVGEITDAVEVSIEEKRNRSTEKKSLGLTWGVPALDEFSGGAHEGEMTVLAGESGGGKTLEAIQMVLENAKEGTPCGIISLEMSKEKLTQRWYPQMSKIITSDIIRDPRLMNLHSHIPEMKRISGELNELPIYIDDASSLNINTLIARIRVMRRKYGIKLFVIDYLQLIVNDAKTEAEAIKGIMFKLRDLLTEEPTIHLLVLSQYSKADGFTKNKRRSRNDLMGSSAIHHAAQNVLLLTIESEEEKDKNDLLDVEFRFDKQRDGKKGKVHCHFDRSHLRFRHAEPFTPIPF